MKMKYFPIIAVAMLAACSSGDKKEEAAGSGAPSAAAEKVADGTTGVPECDNYMNKVMACIKEKIPAEQRSAMEQAINQSKDQWAAIPDKAALAQTCKAATEQAKTAYAAMGCSF
jgi:hypothetical protein